MLRLANSEQQEISAAFDKAEQAVQEAAAAMNNLAAVLESRAACISLQRLQQLEKSLTPINATQFAIQCQRYRICEVMKLDRVLA